MKKIVLVLLLLACSSFAQSFETPPKRSEPLKIHGVYLGQTVTDYLANAPGKLRYAKLQLDQCSKASAKHEYFGLSDRELCELLAKASAGEHVTVRLSHDLPGQTTFDKGVVVEFSDIVLPDHGNPLESPWEKVLYDLKAKIGDPLDTTPVVTQNGFGATFTYRAALWTVRDPDRNSYLYAREAPLESNHNLSIVLLVLTSKSTADHQRELADRPSTID